MAGSKEYEVSALVHANTHMKRGKGVWRVGGASERERERERCVCLCVCV